MVNIGSVVSIRLVVPSDMMIKLSIKLSTQWLPVPSI